MKRTLEQQEKGKELHQMLVQKAWESATFKEKLINNPYKTISEITGSNISNDVKLVVEDQTDSNIFYINIPRKFDVDEIELTDEQLETISGGGDLITGATIAAGVAVATLLGAAFSFGYGVGKDIATK